jgi:hypothetical protein
MKSIILSILFIFAITISFCNSDKEIIIIKVEYSKKKDGFHSKMIVDLGKANSHPLHNKLQNDESGSITYKDENGKLTVFLSEVDLMNFLFSFGYNYKEVYQFDIMSEKFYNFVLVKE